MGVKEYDEILDFQFGTSIKYKFLISQVIKYTDGPMAVKQIDTC